MVTQLTVQSGAYEARTDGSLLEVRRKNGVVVGEGRVAMLDGAFCVGEYTGKLDAEVVEAVEQLLKEHGSDIFAIWMAAETQGLPS